MNPLFEPKSAVLIGSSKIQEKVGMTSPQLFEGVTYNMSKFFKETTFVLDIAEERDYTKLGDLPSIPDLGVIMLPPKQSLEQLKKCAEMGVKAIVVITGGYKRQEREQLISLKREYGVRILGPNTIMGVINTENGLNTTFERDLMPRKGNISVISQSGGVGACLLDWACFYNIGISKFAFMGDKIDISGVTKEAAQRALSHTASIAGSDTVFDAALKKAGIIRVEDGEELINSAVALAKQPPLRGDNIAIVSNVGGPAILAADSIVRNRLKLAILSEKTRKEIENCYPGLEAVNPIDLIADARADRYSVVLDLVLSDPNVDGVMVINMLKSCFFEPEDALAIAKVIDKHVGKPVVDVAAGGEDFTLVHRVLKDTNIPVYNLAEKAAKALKALRTYYKSIEKQFSTT